MEIKSGKVGIMKKCPKCNGPLGDRPALSRRDGKTDICSNCGFIEAMEDAQKAFELKQSQRPVINNV